MVEGNMMKHVFHILFSVVFRRQEVGTWERMSISAEWADLPLSPSISAPRQHRQLRSALPSLAGLLTLELLFPTPTPGAGWRGPTKGAALTEPWSHQTSALTPSKPSARWPGWPVLCRAMEAIVRPVRGRCVLRTEEVKLE